MGRALRRLRWTSFVLGVLAGSGGWWTARELAYVNWKPAASPVVDDELTIRKDAKGDGQFGAPRRGNRHHRGLDLAAALGSPVIAIRSGTVVATGLHRGLGRYVELEHRDELHSLYAHLDSIVVNVGDRIRQGQTLGTVGKTGNARSPLIQPHLHLEVSKSGKVIDPSALGLALAYPVLLEADGASDSGG